MAPGRIDDASTAAEARPENEINHEGKSESPLYKPRQRPYDPRPPVKLIIVGAGIGGVAASILIPNKVPNLEYVVYEKNDTVGGTWTQNRYPGVRCDIPSHAYQLTFAPNPRWSEYYAPGAEIRGYYEDVVEKYGVKPHLHLRHQVTRATWIDEISQWSVEVLNLTTGETFTETAHFFVSAAGRLNVPKMPDDNQIPGIRTEFKGHYRHTADWDTNYDWKGKKIAVIGNGASGQQLLSNMAKDAGHIDHYVRSKQWILPAFSTNLPTATGDAPGGHVFSEDEKTKFEQDEEAYLAFRKELESNLHGGLRHFLTGSVENESLREKCTETMLNRLNGDKEWFERLKPDYAPGCKRLTPSPGYLEAVTSPKVEYIDQPIVRATSNGLVTADGKVREVDAIIAATGFQSGFRPWFPTIGKNGVDLRVRWASNGPIGYPETYFGVMAPDMPNYFAVMQAQTYAVGGTVPLQCETSATYIAKVIRKVQSQGYRAIHPSHEATADFNEIVGNFFDDKVLSDTCTSWLKADKGKSRILVWWPGTGHHRFSISRDPRWEDFVFERSTEARRNRFEYFGDGYTAKEKRGGVENITSYLKEVGKVDLATLHESWNE